MKLRFICAGVEPGNEQPDKGLNVTLRPIEGTPTKDNEGQWDVIGQIKLKTFDKSKTKQEFVPGNEYELTVTQVEKKKVEESVTV